MNIYCWVTGTFYIIWCFLNFWFYFRSWLFRGTQICRITGKLILFVRFVKLFRFDPTNSRFRRVCQFMSFYMFIQFWIYGWIFGNFRWKRWIFFPWFTCWSLLYWFLLINSLCDFRIKRSFVYLFESIENRVNFLKFVLRY